MRSGIVAGMSTTPFAISLTSPPYLAVSNEFKKGMTLFSSVSSHTSWTSRPDVSNALRERMRKALHVQPRCRTSVAGYSLGIVLAGVCLILET